MVSVRHTHLPHRRTLAILMAPLPLVAWWGWRQPTAFLAWALVALLAVSSTAGLGLFGIHAAVSRPVVTTDLADAVPDTPATPVEILSTVAGVDLGELLARVERLEQQAAWVAAGVEDIEVFANLPEPEPDVLAFLEQLDRDDAAG